MSKQQEREQRVQARALQQRHIKELLEGDQEKIKDSTASLDDRFTMEGLSRLFNDLDTNKNGVLEVNELQSALEKLGLPSDFARVAEMLSTIDQNKDGVDFNDFVEFVRVRERELRALFQELDVNHDGVLKADDLRHILTDNKYQLGAQNVSDSKIKILMEEAAGKGADAVNFEEFRRFLVLYPSPSVLTIKSLFDYWLNSAAFDLGEDVIIPYDREVASDPFRILLAGGVAGAASRTLTAPFDRLKVLLQAQTSSLTGEQREYTGIWQGLRKIYIDGGWRGFFKGNGTNVIKIAPECAIKFWGYDYFKKIVCEDPDTPKVLERLCAGSLAGMLAQVLIYPLEIAKTRLAVSKKAQYRGIIHCLSSTVKAEGFFALFRGLVPSVIGVVPYAGVDLAVYSLLKEQWAHRWPEKEPGVIALLCCGATSSTCGQVVAYPFQLIRTRLQTQGMAGRPILYKGMADCFTKTLYVEGVFGLYKGIGPNFLKAVPAVSISYVVYEQARKALGITSVL